MALDGGYLRYICNEINEKAANSRVEKVYQPNKDEIVLVFRGHGICSRKSEGTAYALYALQKEALRQ